MSKKKNITIKLPPKKIPRNSFALAAKMRSGGGFHKNKSEKGGNTNKQTEYMKEAEDEECTCDNPDKGVARGCPIHDPEDRWEDC
jgi:hypothetical protein